MEKLKKDILTALYKNGINYNFGKDQDGAVSVSFKKQIKCKETLKAVHVIGRTLKAKDWEIITQG